MKRVILSIAATACLVACASVQPVQMALPPVLQAADAVTVTGIGGGRTGTFSAGAYAGRFSRSESRLAFFDPLYERRDGRTRISIGGPEIDGLIDVDCRMRERTINLGNLSFEAHPMAYACDFSSEGWPMPARFELQAHRQGLGGMLMRQERRGEIGMKGKVLQIRSVHDLEGSPIQLATPIGYVFDLNGTPVGAVELNGAPVIRFAPGTPADLRQTIIIGSLALGLFWDPADSAL